MKEQLAALQAQQLQASTQSGPSTLLEQLQQLAQLKESGLLTDDEFSAAKAKLLAD